MPPNCSAALDLPPARFVRFTEPARIARLIVPRPQPRRDAARSIPPSSGMTQRDRPHSSASSPTEAAPCGCRGRGCRSGRRGSRTRPSWSANSPGSASRSSIRSSARWRRWPGCSRAGRSWRARSPPPSWRRCSARTRRRSSPSARRRSSTRASRCSTRRRATARAISTPSPTTSGSTWAGESGARSGCATRPRSAGELLRRHAESHFHGLCAVWHIRAMLSRRTLALTAALLPLAAHAQGAGSPPSSRA